jgi:hypothetical protein
MNVHTAEHQSLPLTAELLASVLSAIVLLAGMALDLPDLGLLSVLVGIVTLYLVARIRYGQRDIPASWQRWTVGSERKR